MQFETPTRRDVEGYGLTTAQIIYRLPDHREVLQEFLWQQYDLFPASRRWENSSASGRKRSRGRCIRSLSRTRG
jgi:hypothetical protein